MPKRVRSRIRRQKRGRSPATLLLILLVWSILMGWGLSLAVGATVKPEIVAQATSTIGTVDPIPERYQLGKELYLENCATCHIAIPPEVLPSESWRRLLLEPEQHYGKQLEPILGPSRLILWEYLKAFSRPLIEKEKIPFGVSESRFFKALHPRVKLPKPVRPASCVTCHPGVAQFNFRSLTAEWEKAP
jgi:hypothetical protein